MNTRNTLIVVGIIILLLIGYFAYSKMHSNDGSDMGTTTQSAALPVETQTPSTDTTGASSGASTGTSGGAAASHVTITYTKSGFSPANVSIPVGGTVTWVNQSGGSMWVASGQHPSHTVYDGTSVAEHCAAGAPKGGTVFDECAAGSSFTFTFTKTGTWSYHNHANASDHGAVTVQ